ncbi:SCP2 sterol-binding domain-containing protein [Catenuloplanes atrovinosus]|uniref:Sterol carrier protein n=1 Tax=Catenuloplanes atrovinosus TaxID=137266 RepID=A0AAE3YVW3_9ACTN|nr:SCP2 sterol-binding domain-containing protein [Catenuloplanes atrovinosus]MDR7280192.1 putative sterol carrier protein [Catenuloplanes atrovinosus]
MTDFDPSTFATMEPREFARIVKSMPDSAITEIMSGPHRQLILDEVFSRMPKQFRPERAGDTSAVIHWTVTGRPDGGADTYEVVIDGGTCALSPSTDRKPDLTLAVAPVPFVKLIAGLGNPVMMFMTGKLKAQGDLGLAAQIQTLFDIPKA